MRVLWESRASRGLQAGLAALGAVWACAGAAAQARSEVVACGSAAPPPLRLAWREAPGADSVARLAGTTAHLRVENAARVGVLARVDVTLTMRGEVVTRRLPGVWIEPGRAAYLPVSLDTDSGSRPDATAYAVAFAAALPSQGPSLGRAAGPVLYFHDEQGLLLVYGEDALRMRFAGGVLPAGVQRPTVVPAGATLEMALDGRTGERSGAPETFDEAAAERRERARASVVPQGGR